MSDLPFRWNLWATSIEERDLDLLVSLPHLEYLSIADYDAQCRYHGAAVLEKLAALPSLKQLWCERVHFSAAEKSILQSRYSYARVT
jgi:hypothetical protein